MRTNRLFKRTFKCQRTHGHDNKQEVTDLCIFFHRKTTTIPKVTLTAREIENKATNTLLKSELSSSKLALAVDSKAWNNIFNIFTTNSIRDTRMPDDELGV